ncbi:acetyl-CoA carboxylase, biotin carboxylase subunit [Secundilactobacillus pentosiphilus]|uniref:biotin carboxylase n=1 Tax=Secundilactobacillus pentosiphilus TaxID=1714682 RepID=A0A1Z5ILU0_9LACO|nr:acetyl-CoA carboxylase biotin carboxylase subunit [Secundilactobacillus pentosiphilus]GAX02727.1 acetyl-CoA carboxylase, biotin carboxylase subunit [Secundilactobacillus pentosiphilus]
MFKKVLIANRGEIAVRIIRALRELNVSSVAVYSTADADAQYVNLADEAVCIGGPQPADSYLNMQNIVSAAVLTGAEAIHPGYGFLSENEEFAELCETCHITFIGPKPATISLMGNKANARAQMQAGNVPVIPGSTGFLKDEADAVKVASEVGYPVMLKAASGGGGKGIRRVKNEGEMREAYQSATKEAQLSFGDQRMYLEKIIAPAKHIEVQVFADQFGHVTAFPERDCSLQRRQQKVLELSPCPVMNEQERQELQAIAIRATKTIKYLNTGTIEFLMDSNHHFYFMEMNTRIQVEHPITEAVSGIDLVKEQVRVASGEALSFEQADLKPHGFAVEARVNAEDPAMDFMPQAGVVKQLKLPGGPGIRVDSGIQAGDMISPFYDSMIVKIIAHANTYHEALKKLIEALDEFELDGIAANQSFLEALLADPVVQQGTATTDYVTKQFMSKFNKHVVREVS